VIQIPDLPPVEDDVLEAELDAPRTFSDDELTLEPPPDESAPSADRKQCPVCGEMIMREAVKCRYCGEIFDTVLRQKEQKTRRQAAGEEDMSVGDWVVAVICSGIGCIFGIVWMIQGKPKGKKMFIVSLCSGLIWGVLSALLQAANQNRM
jgi:hypothetical protein